MVFCLILQKASNAMMLIRYLHPWRLMWFRVLLCPTVRKASSMLTWAPWLIIGLRA